MNLKVSHCPDSLKSFSAIPQHFLLQIVFSSIFPKQREVRILLCICATATNSFVALTSSSLVSTSAVSYWFIATICNVASVTNLFLMERSQS